jgi:hypothetical protein
MNSETRDIDINSNTQGSTRGQKDVIIRKNSSKKLITRPTSQGGSHLNTREEPVQYKQQKKVDMNKQVFNLQNTAALENSILNNSSYIANSNINSPQNMNGNVINLQNHRSVYKNKQGNLNNTETTNANSDAALGGSSSVPHKQH